MPNKPLPIIISRPQPIIVITTEQAAHMLGMTTKALGMYLSRYPSLRPVGRISGNDLLWTPEEVERVREQRERKRKTE